jgi:hypothetical protein
MIRYFTALFTCLGNFYKAKNEQILALIIGEIYVRI